MCVPAQSEPTVVLWIPWQPVLDDVGRPDEVDGDERGQDERVSAAGGRRRTPAAASETPSAAQRTWSRWIRWSCAHHHGMSAKVSETALVLMKRAYGMKNGRIPATIAAATSDRGGDA